MFAMCRHKRLKSKYFSQKDVPPKEISENNKKYTHDYYHLDNLVEII